MNQLGHQESVGGPVKHIASDEIRDDGQFLRLISGEFFAKRKRCPTWLLVVKQCVSRAFWPRYE
jgi:hypothetical protein